MRVAEIFTSIEGEGRRMGQLVSFVRLSGCNLNCSYCDTPYAHEKNSGQEMEMAEIIAAVEMNKLTGVTLTGGEPLLTSEGKQLLQMLACKKYEVNVETNGSIPIDFARKNTNTAWQKNIFFTMDYKTPSSGCHEAMKASNLYFLNKEDVLKLVLSADDLNFASNLLKKHPVKATIYLSPIYKKTPPLVLVDFVRKLATEGIDVSNIRVQVQLHKVIWTENMRGV